MPGMGMGGHGHRGRGGDAPDSVESLKITDTRMLKWFYANLAPHWFKVVLGLTGMILATICHLRQALVLRDIFDDVIVGHKVDMLPRLILTFAALALGGVVFSALRTIVMHLLGQRFVYKIRMECYRHMMKLGMNYFEKQQSGDLMSRISNDVDGVEVMVVHGSDDIISNVLYILGATYYLFTMEWRLAIVALAPVPIYVVLVWVFSHYVRPIFHKIRKELGEINAKLQERITGIQVVKAFAREKAEIDYFEESSYAYWRASAKSIWMWSTFFPILSLVTTSGMIFMIWYGARQTSQVSVGGIAAVSAGTMVAFLRLMMDFYRPIGALARVQNMINRALASITRIFELLDEQPSVKDKTNALDLEHVEGRVELDHVAFKYDTGEQVLHDISVVAEPGEMVAIVGRSGAGKTTLVNLIARFYDPVRGRVLVDGHDARDITQESLRRNIGMVLQETFLFNATVRENIQYARPNATDKEIERAARAAHAHDFIGRFEKGYETVIGERGVRLSGGEKQRVAIARAFLVNPQILILDEATSMVDTEAEQVIQRALIELMQGRTTFVIAHRLSTVRRADKIIVIDAGRIVEQDRHEALMARNGLYREMVARQFHMNDQEWDGTGDPPESYLR